MHRKTWWQKPGLRHAVVTGVGVPGWVLAGATFGMDFANSRYYGDTLANLTSLSRASSATDLLPSSASGFAYATYGNDVRRINSSGFLGEDTATNLLLNSTAPATQTTASLGTGTYTLWVNGSGSAAVAGNGATITGGAGSATNGSPKTFTVTVAGTVDITVTGSLNAFQLEAGSIGTSFIPTTGVTATRAADNISLAGAALTLWRTNSFSGVLSMGPLGKLGSFANPGGGSNLYTDISSRVIMTFGGATIALANSGSGNFLSNSCKIGFSAKNPGGSAVLNNGTVATQAANNFSGGASAGTLLNGNSGYVDAHMKSLFLFSTVLSDAALKAFTV